MMGGLGAEQGLTKNVIFPNGKEREETEFGKIRSVKSFSG